MPPLLTAEQLAGVFAKLERADENIHNLNTEVVAFLKECPDGGFGEDKQQAAREFAKFHAGRPIPLGFGVLAGEIVHHLRSALDHIVWLLSTESYRSADEREIGFPILTVRPLTRDKRSVYDRKVAGIASADALRLIEQVQPYNAPNPLDNPLAIIHDLDRIDKHQTIALVVTSWDLSITVPFSAMTGGEVIGGPHMSYEDFAARPTENLKLEFTAQIAFASLGQRMRQNVTPALTHLSNAARDVVRLFGS